jgi:hypothetical protein
VRWNEDDLVDLGGPGLGGDLCCEPQTQRFREVVATAVLEGEDGRTKDPVVFTPNHRCLL